MNTSMVGKKYMENLNIKANTLYETQKGESDYKYAEPYGVIKDDFVSIASSPDTTNDEKAIAKLGLLINDSWGPDAGLNRASILNAHRGLLEIAEKEYESQSENQIGVILADATLNALSMTLSLNNLHYALEKESITADFLSKGFESIMSSNATKKQKTLAKRGLKNTTEYEYEGGVPAKIMNDIAGKTIQQK
jgi:hypothetical protein